MFNRMMKVDNRFNLALQSIVISAATYLELVSFHRQRVPLARMDI